MATVVTKTVQVSGGDYTSLSAWEAAQQGDLTGARDEVARVECSSNLQDAADVVVDGWTTDATRYIHITTPLTERHGCVWDNTKYRLSPSGQVSLSIRENYTRVEGLQVEQRADENSCYGIQCYGAVYGSRISHNIVRPFQHPDAYTYGLNGCGINLGTDTAGAVFCWNNLVILNLAKTGGVGIVHTHASTGLCYVYNNTVIAVGYGVGFGDGFAGMVAKNNLAVGCADGFDGTRGWGDGFAAGSDYNASDIASDAPGANSNNGTAPTFVDAPNGDYRLAATDAVARDEGVDLSADGALAFTDDFHGETRSGTWDIGADEYVAAVATRPRPGQLLNAAALSRASRW